MKSLRKSPEIDVIEVTARHSHRKNWPGYTFDQLNERMTENRVEIAVEQAAIRMQMKDDVMERFANPLRLAGKLASGLVVAKYSFKLFGWIKKAHKLVNSVKNFTKKS